MTLLSREMTMSHTVTFSLLLLQLLFTKTAFCGGHAGNSQSEPLHQTSSTGNYRMAPFARQLQGHAAY